MRRALPFIVVGIFIAALAASMWPQLKTKLGLDLVGGLRGEYQVVATDHQAGHGGHPRADPRHHREPRERDRRLGADRLRRRAPTASRVELPGAENADDIRKLIGTTGRLDFMPVPASTPAAIRRCAAARGHGPRRPSSAATRSPPRARDQTRRRGQLVVDLRAQGQGRPALRRVRRRPHQGEQFAIVLDGNVSLAPVHQATALRRTGRRSAATSRTQSMNDLVHRPEVRLAAARDPRGRLQQH